MVGTLKLVNPGEPWLMPTWESTVDGKRADGSRRQMRERRQCKTRKEAEAWHNTRLAAAINGTIESKRDRSKREKVQREKTARESIGASIDHWLAECERKVSASKPSLSSSAFGRYELAARQIKALVGERSIAGFEQFKTRKALFQELERRGGQNGKTLGRRSVEHARTVIRQSFGAAVEAELVASNPFVGMKLDFLDSKKSAARKPPPDDVVNRILAATEAEAYQHLAIPVLLAAATGMRMGEILALHWSNVDLDAAKLDVTRSLDGTTMTIKKPKTESGKREINLDDDVVVALRAHKAKQNEWASQCYGRYKLGLVNCDLNGDLWKTGTFSKMYARFARALGVAASFHDLRHFHGSQLNKHGVDAKTISTRLGHSDVRFTMQRYVHSDAEQDRRAASVMGSVLRAAKEAAKEADEAAT
jgi:integrase